MEVYERIRKRRKELDISADDVAEAIGVSRATVYRYESKDIDNMPLTTLEPLAKILKCSPGYLMGWEQNAQSDFTVSSDEMELIVEYRNAGVETQNMIKRLLAYEQMMSERDKIETVNSVDDKPVDIFDGIPDTAEEFEKLYPPIGELKPDKNA